MSLAWPWPLASSAFRRRGMAREAELPQLLKHGEEALAVMDRDLLGYP